MPTSSPNVNFKIFTVRLGPEAADSSDEPWIANRLGCTQADGDDSNDDDEDDGGWIKLGWRVPNDADVVDDDDDGVGTRGELEFVAAAAIMPPIMPMLG